MYRTRVTANIKTVTKQPTQSQVVSNPLTHSMPSQTRVESKQDAQHRIITSIMFWGLGIVAVSLFYFALSSLML